MGIFGLKNKPFGNPASLHRYNDADPSFSRGILQDGMSKTENYPPQKKHGSHPNKMLDFWLRKGKAFETQLGKIKAPLSAMFTA
jgi:hypothetical protein